MPRRTSPPGTPCRAAPWSSARSWSTAPTTLHYELDKALTSLGIGEAIVTVLGETGAPTPVAWTRLRAPRSLMGTIGDDAVRQAAAASELHGQYAETVDRESAYERMAHRAARADEPRKPDEQRKQDDDEPGFVEKVMGNSAVKSFLRSAASAVGREVTRGLFGTRRR